MPGLLTVVDAPRTPSTPETPSVPVVTPVAPLVVLPFVPTLPGTALASTALRPAGGACGPYAPRPTLQSDLLRPSAAATGRALTSGRPVTLYGVPPREWLECRDVRRINRDIEPGRAPAAIEGTLAALYERIGPDVSSLSR